MSTGASLERLAVTQDAAGSSPVAPANSLLSTLLSMHVRKHFSAPSGRGRSFFLTFPFIEHCYILIARLAMLPFSASCGWLISKAFAPDYIFDRHRRKHHSAFE
jgi:hypothetical protein